MVYIKSVKQKIAVEIYENEMGEKGMGAELIAAAATAWGRSAVGIVRLSGEGAAAAAGGVFFPADGRTLTEHAPRTLVYGTLRDAAGNVLDHILCTWSAAPHTYTGEETAELQCHGSPTVLALALEALFAQGARQARPGEFTKRAFLNGKLDLAQAEAVIDLIDAETPQAVRQAAGQLSGALSRRVEGIYDGLVDVMAHFHAVLDYPDEDIDPFTGEVISDALDRAAGELETLLDTYGRGRIVREGVPTAIVGAPNVGKSTLLNALVGYERAIVTDIPGTTRDTVEEKCVLGGVLLRLMDTAGIRDTDDRVEKLGVERSRRAMEEARLILLVMDNSRPAGAEDGELLKLAVSLAPTVVVLNKSDLPRGLEWSDELDIAPTCPVSAKEGRGLEGLAQRVAELFPHGAEADGEVLTNARQAEAARRALEAVRSALSAQREGVTPDAVLTDVEGALAALGELTGKSVREDVTNRIFERFCVGK